jgi:hypothetical protein
MIGLVNKELKEMWKEGGGVVGEANLEALQNLWLFVAF